MGSLLEEANLTRLVDALGRIRSVNVEESVILQLRVGELLRLISGARSAACKAGGPFADRNWAMLTEHKCEEINAGYVHRVRAFVDDPLLCSFDDRGHDYGGFRCLGAEVGCTNREGE
jgi:hypothetical protein